MIDRCGAVMACLPVAGNRNRLRPDTFRWDTTMLARSILGLGIQSPRAGSVKPADRMLTPWP